MSPARNNLPEHLQRYVVEQNYARYTPQDQAVWRFIMRQLKEFLSRHAHHCYVEGLNKTGIEIDRIPRIDEMDLKLAEFGWGAVPVSGFIPPAAFMEFQSLGILPIASDMRSIQHLTYTPAPDIVHEAAGHAPILIHPTFAGYLKKYAAVARHAIVTREDMEQYAAIRELSDVKEAPSSTRQDIARAEARLNEVNRHFTSVSEAGWLSRMNWWTAEYGLIGSLKDPTIFGAGLLSSVGESRQCLSDKVKKIPLTIDCIETSYDITEPQPQLFVTPDFETLSGVLDQLAGRMAFRLGGPLALERAQKAGTVITVELDSGLQISGILESFTAQGQQVEFLRFQDGTSLAYHNRQLQGHGADHHAQGYSTPLGPLKGRERPLWRASDSDLNQMNLRVGQVAHLEFASGLELNGELQRVLRQEDKLVLLTFTKARLRRGDQILFDPSWGVFDLAVGHQVVSVSGGAADREAFGETDDFVAQKVPARMLGPEQHRLFDLYSAIRQLRPELNPGKQKIWLNLAETFLQHFPSEWLLGIELIEMREALGLATNHPVAIQLEGHLRAKSHPDPITRGCIDDGLRLAGYSR